MGIGGATGPFSSRSGGSSHLLRNSGRSRHGAYLFGSLATQLPTVTSERVFSVISGVFGWTGEVIGSPGVSATGSGGGFVSEKGWSGEGEGATREGRRGGD